MMSISTVQEEDTMRLRRSFTGLALSLTLLFGLAAPAMAQESSSVSRERLEYLCSKVPLIEARVRAAIAWINGDSDTRGSIAWLEVKAEQAEARGFTDLARRIRLRIEVLTERLDVLEARLERLAMWEARCDELLGAA
jgi:hypothetical protein